MTVRELPLTVFPEDLLTPSFFQRLGGIFFGLVRMDMFLVSMKLSSSYVALYVLVLLV